MKKIIFSILLLFTFTLYVNAECNDDDLLTYANNVKIKYETSDNIENPEYLYYLYLEPQRDDIEIKSTNSLYGGVTKGSNMENGKYGIPSRIHFEEKTYKFEIYVKSTAKACAGEKLTELSYTVPPYNYYSNTQYCVEHPELDMCQKMADTKDMSNEEFTKKAAEYEEKQNDEKERSLLFRIVFDYLIWIIVPAAIIGFIYYKKISKVKKVKENA